MLDKRYQINQTVAHAYCDHRHHARLSYLLAVAQQISMEHCDSVGIGGGYFHERGMVLLLAKLRLVIARPPHGGELVTLDTQPNLPTRAQYRRLTSFGVGGELVAELDARWVLVDIASRRLLRKAPDGIDLPFNEPEELAELRPTMPDDMELRDEVTVRYSMLDINGHMNNTVYGDIICNLLEHRLLADRQIATVEIFYHREAMPGDRISLWLGEQGDNFFVRGCVDDTACFEAQGSLSVESEGSIA